ncbi:radical SAM protein [Methanomassiliicoccus luminyensis]|jgi:radical SAM superfamily enzyme with C-terminal helix-hairpin-helix motif|uniref:radical SAM protein n=1 Tax=Methanomassiliicoccus luminyensis TaxID=1080712 RepID=UPI000ACCBEBD|nr:radical SAM protein [Methanomassiliicoccus luminyensis]
MMKVLVVDGYIDEPACLGVPPYISPQVRAIAGAAVDAGAEAIYSTVDRFRKGEAFPRADLSVLMAGAAVPGKYLRAMPASGKEVERMAAQLPGMRVLAGPAVLEPRFRDGGMFHHLASRDPAAMVYDLLTGKEPSGRWRSVEEWNRWLLAGADIVRDHPDFPQPLIAEIETYRGCVRHSSGGCSFCVEPLKGAPSFRDEEDIIDECRKLHELGVRNFRLGAQTCIISYKADLSTGDPPRPNPAAVERLFSGIADLGVDVLHVDNANPAVIAAYPDEGREVLRSLVRHCTPGNVLALGMESADPMVVEANNLNSTAEQVMDAIRIINEEGGEVGENGLPRLLPGLNLIIGLDGETPQTLEIDHAFLKEVLDRGYLLRRLNIRQVIPIRREFSSPISHAQFVKFKERVREEIDRPMLSRLVPEGRALRGVYTELRDGGTTFGRQIGSYPLLIGIPYPVELGKFVDVAVVGWGYRSITAIEHPLRINSCPLKALEALPGVGRKRAVRLFRKRPLRSMDDLAKALDDPKVAAGLKDLVSFD